jgi:hypothetical protein
MPPLPVFQGCGLATSTTLTARNGLLIGITRFAGEVLVETIRRTRDHFYERLASNLSTADLCATHRSSLLIHAQSGGNLQVQAGRPYVSPRFFLGNNRIASRWVKCFGATTAPN